MSPPRCERSFRSLLARGGCSGRSVVYSLYDNHVAQLLDDAIYHIEHLRPGAADQPDAVG
jgi:hypothetical protein